MRTCVAFRSSQLDDDMHLTVAFFDDLKTGQLKELTAITAEAAIGWPSTEFTVTTEADVGLGYNRATLGMAVSVSHNMWGLIQTVRNWGFHHGLMSVKYGYLPHISGLGTDLGRVITMDAITITADGDRVLHLPL